MQNLIAVDDMYTENPYRNVFHLPAMATIVQNERALLDSLLDSLHAAMRLNDNAMIDHWNAVISYQRWRVICAQKRLSQITD